MRIPEYVSELINKHFSDVFINSVGSKDKQKINKANV